LEFFRLLSTEDIHTILDVGAGRNWFFGERVKSGHGLRLIGVDIDANEMAANACLDERLEANACLRLPVSAGSIDLITVRAGFEHFEDNTAFLDNCRAALRPGGFVLLAFAGRFAPFALLNRLLPAQFSGWLLNRLIPDQVEKLGFKAHYDLCFATALRRTAKAQRFDVQSLFPDYYSSDYFGFALPLYLASLACDHARNALGIENLASYYTLVLKKQE
jgi:SAM-dependent methyltransferase